MDELRNLLHQLADRVAVTLERRTTPPPSMPDSDAAVRALKGIAAGDLAIAELAALESSPQDTDALEAVRRVRELVSAARAALDGGHHGVDEVRAAAERAADGASRQRIALERASEQLRQLGLRSSELSQWATQASELADRASLLALNVGIEGLRVGGDVARALGSLGDELRKLSQRTAASTQEVSVALRALSDQSKAALAAVDDARAGAQRAADEATRAAAAAGAVRRQDEALNSAIVGFRAYDGETESLLGEIAASTGRIHDHVQRARTRLVGLTGPAREALEAALQRLEAASRGEKPSRG